MHGHAVVDEVGVVVGEVAHGEEGGAFGGVAGHAVGGGEPEFCFGIVGVDLLGAFEIVDGWGKEFGEGVGDSAGATVGGVVGVSFEGGGERDGGGGVVASVEGVDAVEVVDDAGVLL